MLSPRWPLVACIAILALAAVECCALLCGVDGQLAGLVVAAIAGIAGYTLRGVTHQ